MSFFIWSSLPDDELLALAEKKELSKPAVLKARLQRMLRDDRAISLTRDFAFPVAQRCQARPDRAGSRPVRPRRWRLRRAPGLQERAGGCFIDSILRSDRSVVDLLTADHNF